MRYIALLFVLITPAFAQDFGSMQIGGNHSCPPNRCFGGFETYGIIRPKVYAFLGCGYGSSGPCRLGMSQYVLAHVTPIGTRGDPSSQYDVVYEAVRIGTQWTLRNHSITASCTNPGVHVKGEWNLD